MLDFDELIQRRIKLKKQLIIVTRQEIKELEERLKEIEKEEGKVESN
jgi:hypothetical protein